MASVTETQKTPTFPIHQNETMKQVKINNNYGKFEAVALAIILGLAVTIGAVAGVSAHSLVVGMETGATAFVATGMVFAAYLYVNLLKDLRTQREAANSPKDVKCLYNAQDNVPFRDLDSAIVQITNDLKERHPHSLVDTMHKEIRELAEAEQKLQFRKDAAKLGADFAKNNLVWDEFAKAYQITNPGLTILKSEIENDLKNFYSSEFVAANKQLIVMPPVTLPPSMHPEKGYIR